MLIIEFYFVLFKIEGFKPCLNAIKVDAQFSMIEGVKAPLIEIVNSGLVAHKPIEAIIMIALWWEVDRGVDGRR